LAKELQQAVLGHQLHGIVGRYEPALKGEPNRYDLGADKVRSQGGAAQLGEKVFAPILRRARSR
jgi:hypothetical protein